MIPSLRRWLPARPVAPKTARSRFRPALQALDDRITPTFNLAAQQTFAVGNNVQAVSVGDFNGDGRADLAVANGSAATGVVSVLLNTTATGATTPTYASSQTFAVGGSPNSVSVGDFNGDGRADVATANGSGGTVSVLLNTTAAGASTPTFAAQQSFTTGNTPASVSVGDFNGDGRADLAVANYGANTVSVLLNATAAGASTPTFAAKQDFAVGTNPNSVSVGDFNGDGRADLATANYTAKTVSVLLNATAAGAAAPTFAAQQTFAVGGAGTYSASVLAGDVNGDGRADLTVSNPGYNSVSVLLNATAAGAVTPTFASQQTFTVGSGPNSVAVGDFNGDGRTDLTVANGTGGTVSVLLNTSTGVAVTTPSLTGQFGTTGVWGYNRATNTWANLTVSNADALAAAPNGNLVANFGGNGVWYYRASTATWTQINIVGASALAIDQYGNAFANFAGYGTYMYRLATSQWAQLAGTGATANKLAVSANGDVVANFAGYGVYRFRWTTGWAQLKNVTATALAVGPNGDVAASFAGVGTAVYKPTTGWTTINGVAASSLSVGAEGAVAAVFPGYGVAKYVPYANGWASLTVNGAGISVAMDLFGNVFASFAGGGVWEFDAASGWHQRRTNDASLLGLGR